MAIIIATISILAITVLVGLLNKVLPFKVCPICAGVSMTWLWLTAAGLYGFIPSAAYQPIILLLMGGTVVGVAFQGERSMDWAGRRPLLWKTAAVIVGFPAAFWAAALAGPAMLAAEAVLLAILIYLFFIRPATERGDEPVTNQIKELEKKLEDCC